MKIVDRPSFSQRTTLGLGGLGLAELQVGNDRDWDDVLEFVDREGAEPFVLGKGSNILAADGQLPLVLIRVDREEPRILSQAGDRTVIGVGAGFPLPGLLGWLAGKGLSGLEPLTGIPGSVGGGVAMNAGSYGQTLGEVLQRVQIMTRRQGVTWLDKGDVSLGYRHFAPGLDEGFWLITRVDLELSTERPEKIRSRMRTWYQAKKAAQPVTARTCGCVFKNPSLDLPAGLALDRCGLKGRRAGQVGFSERHANFLVNYGQGRSRDAFELLDLARDKVKARFGVQLELEVVALGAPAT